MYLMAVYTINSLISGALTVKLDKIIRFDDYLSWEVQQHFYLKFSLKTFPTVLAMVG